MGGNGSQGFTMVELALVTAVIGILAAASFHQYEQKALVANLSVTRHNAEAVAIAGKAWWSNYRSAPPSLATLATQRFFDSPTPPNNPLGGPFVVTTSPLGPSAAMVVVQAPLSLPAPMTQWATALHACCVTAAGNGVEWHYVVSEYADSMGASSEAFRSMY